MFSRLLELIALALDEAGLAYMIIGGQAVLIYGEPRTTKDIDVTLGVDLDRLADVEAVVARLGLTPLVDPQEFTRATMVLPCADPASGVRVDFVLSDSEYERQALGRTKAVGIGRAKVRFAAVEDLVVHKIVAGRPRDMEDVKGILLKNPNIDAAYVETWLQRFSNALSEPLLDRFRALREP